MEEHWNYSDKINVIPAWYLTSNFYLILGILLSTQQRWVHHGIFYQDYEDSLTLILTSMVHIDPE